MFLHNFKYSFKTLLKNKVLIFWTFAFPIILGTLFSMAFSDIEKNEKLDVIPIAITGIDDYSEKEYYKSAFDALSDKDNDDRLFDITYRDENEAKELLEKDEISAYITFQDKVDITVKKSGIDETIIKFALEEIKETNTIVQKLVESKMATGQYVKEQEIAKLYKDIINKVNELQNSEIEVKDISRGKLSYTMIEYYTLIAMACLYGGMLGMTAINKNLANMSSHGKRISVSPTKKSTLIISSALSSYLISLVGLLLLFLYLIFLLKIDFGSNIPLIILLSCAGSFAGLSMGIAVSSLLKSNENMKTGIMIAVTMLGCFLSGMMGITMKYVVDTNIPILNKINPASMITDGFYALYYYDTYDRYIFNLVSILLFGVFMLAISMYSLRRQRYDSI